MRTHGDRPGIIDRMARATLDKDPRDVAGMFDTVARRYDLTNAVLSAGQDSIWRIATRRAVAAHVGDTVLDLAAGTGTSSAEFADDGVTVVPCDFSTGMVRVGKQRRPDLGYVAGDAMALPFADSSFDAVTISFGLRNVADPVRGLQEMMRVTRPGGRLVVCEFSRPTNALIRAGYTTYLRHLLPQVARLVSSDPTSYEYLSETILAWPAQYEFANVIRQAGWTKVQHRNLSGGIVALHRARRPE